MKTTGFRRVGIFRYPEFMYTEAVLDFGFFLEEMKVAEKLGIRIVYEQEFYAMIGVA